MKHNWLLVFSLFTKFGVERVNTFKVIENNVKFPRNRVTFRGVLWPLRDSSFNFMDQIVMAEEEV